MRYPAEEKLEIIRLVERSSRPAKWTLDKLGVPRRTFYRWYNRYLHYGEDGLVDRAPHPGRVWNKIPRVSWLYALRILRAILSQKAQSIVF